MATDSITVFDVKNDHHIEWAQFRKGVLEEGRVDTDQDGVDRRLTKTSFAVLGIPSDQIFMRVLDLPTTDPEELSGMVELQLDKMFPFPIDQMVLSHEVLSYREGGCTVLAAAARSSAILAVGETLKQAGSKIGRVDALLLGRWQTLLASGCLAKKGRETLVLMDDGHMNVLTHDAGVLIALGSLGEVSLVDEPDYAAEVALEIEHLLMGLNAEHGQPDSIKVSIWSLQEEGKLLAQALEKRIDTAVQCLSLDQLPSVLSGLVDRARNAEPEALIDLTPHIWREAEKAVAFRRQMAMTGAALFGGWLLLAGLLWGGVALQRTHVQRLRDADERWMEPANEVRRLRMQVQMIRRYTDRRFSALETLREISMLQPAGVDLTSFTYRKDDGVELVGEADSGALVILFNERLNDSDFFDAVVAGPRTLTPRQRHRFSFEIGFNMEAQ